MSNAGSMDSARFSAAISGEHGPALLSKIDKADHAIISDPLFFPWELLSAVGTQTPLVVDVSRCSPNDITALRPVLSVLGTHDSIVNTRAPNDPVARSLSQEYRTRYELPTPAERSALRDAKIIDQNDEAIIARLDRSFKLQVFDWEEFGPGDWTNFSWADDSDVRPSAIVVRVPASVVREARPGFDALLDHIVSVADGMHVLEVSGIRTGPGAPLARALVTIGAVS